MAILDPAIKWNRFLKLHTTIGANACPNDFASSDERKTVYPPWIMA
jgi:hypothetical protein